MVDDIEITQLRNDFHAYYTKKLAKYYAGVMKTRRKLYLKNIFTISLHIFVAELFIFLFITIFTKAHILNLKGITYALLIYIVLSLITILLSHGDMKTTPKDFKNILAFFDNFEQKKFIAPTNKKTELPLNKYQYLKTEINKSNLFDYPCDNRTTDDTICGTYHETDVYISEDTLSFHQKNSFEFNFFQGLLVFLKTKKDFKLPVIVRYSLFKFDLHRIKSVIFTSIIVFITLIILAISLFTVCFSIINNDFDNLSNFDDMLKILTMLILSSYYLIKQRKKRGLHIQTEDVVFENGWNVYAKDQIEARCIITPAVMERLVKIRKIFKRKNISFSFYENNILVAIPSRKDMFDTYNCFGKITEKKIFSEVILPMYQIFKLIDELKLKK